MKAMDCKYAYILTLSLFISNISSSISLHISDWVVSNADKLLLIFVNVYSTVIIFYSYRPLFRLIPNLWLSVVITLFNLLILMYYNIPNFYIFKLQSNPHIFDIFLKLKYIKTAKSISSYCLCYFFIS